MESNLNAVNLATVQNGVERVSANLDQRALDQLAWMAHVTDLALRTKCAPSVLIRAAIDRYAQHLDRVLAAEDVGRLNREALAVRRAAKGSPDALPPEQLIATPPQPFGPIEAEARDKRAERARKAFQGFLKSPPAPGMFHE